MITTMSDAEFERIAGLVRRDDPACRYGDVPDGKYQTRTATLKTLFDEVTACLSEGFRGRASDEFPTLHCAVAGAASDRPLWQTCSASPACHPISSR